MLRHRIFSGMLVASLATALAACANPELVAPTSPFDFGKVLVGTSKSQSLAMTTTGSGKITVFDIRPAGGDHRQFTVAPPGGRYPADVTAPAPLATTATFTPDDKRVFNTTISAQLIAGKTKGFPLATTGEGIFNSSAGVIIMDVAAPSGLDFGDQLVNTTGGPKTIKFTNRSNTVLPFVVTKPAATSVFSTNIVLATVTLGAGQSMTYTVKFKPTAVATYHDAIILTLNATNFAGITLVGKGKRPSGG